MHIGRKGSPLFLSILFKPSIYFSFVCFAIIYISTFIFKIRALRGKEKENEAEAIFGKITDEYTNFAFISVL